jgi:hypothetical protein
MDLQSFAETDSRARLVRVWAALDRVATVIVYQSFYQFRLYTLGAGAGIAQSV